MGYRWDRQKRFLSLPASVSSENFPDTLNCADVKIFSQNKCERAYPGKINEGMICAGNSNGADTCQVSDLCGPPHSLVWMTVTQRIKYTEKPCYPGRVQRKLTTPRRSHSEFRGTQEPCL